MHVAVAIVGAGPYGLSVAAHLQAKNISYRIFGEPAKFWRSSMPEGMHLKSEGFASNLSNPGMTFPLAEYCRQNNLPYQDTELPVALSIFSAYAEAFQERFVSHIDKEKITSLERQPDGKFVLRTQSGETCTADAVVLAVGIEAFRRIPDELKGLPQGVVLHSTEVGDVSQFKDRKVIVVGGGSSAVDVAVLAQEAGAQVRLIARRAALDFHNGPSADRRRPPFWRWKPGSGLGPGFKSRFYTDAPHWFRHFPTKKRLAIVAKHLGPASGWFMRSRFYGHVALETGTRLAGAHAENGSVTLFTNAPNGAKTFQADHVIAATGFQVDLTRLDFLSPALVGGIETVGGFPVLSGFYETSEKNLFILGAAAAGSFGPVMRFVYGCERATPRLAARLARL